MPDGHVAIVLGSLAAYIATINGASPKGWLKKLAHQQPIVMGSALLCGVAIMLPLTVVPIRRSLGYPTNQYDPFHPNAKVPRLPKEAL